MLDCDVQCVVIHYISDMKSAMAFNRPARTLWRRLNVSRQLIKEHIKKGIWCNVHSIVLMYLSQLIKCPNIPNTSVFTSLPICLVKNGVIYNRLAINSSGGNLRACISTYGYTHTLTIDEWFT